MDSTGWVIARGTGKVTGSVVSLIPGYKPFVHRFEVVMVPDAPASIRIAPLPTKLVVGPARSRDGQRLHEDQRSSRDRRHRMEVERARCRDGGRRRMIVAVAPGKANITATDAPPRRACRCRSSRTRSPTSRSRRASSRPARATSCASRVAAKDAQGSDDRGPHADVDASRPGKGMIDSDGAFVALRAGHVHGDAPASASAVARRGRERSTMRDVRRPATVVGTSAAHAFTTERSLDPPERQASPTSAPAAAAIACTRSTSAIPAQPDDRRLDHREHAPRERRDDDARRQVPGRSRARARADRKNGIVIARHARSAAPEADQRVHRRRHGRRALGVHLHAAEVRHAHLSHERRHRRAARHRHQRSGAPKQVAQWKTPRADAGPLRCTTSTCRTACSTRATGTTAS